MAVDLETVWTRLAALCRVLPRATEGTRYPYGPDVLRGFRIGNNRDKVFAFVAFDLAERGVYLRSVDPRVLGDPRFEASQRYFLSGGRGNWVRLKWTDEEPDWTMLGPLVVESHRLAGMNNQGVPARSSFGDLHRILGRALETAAAAERPAPPHHAGGPAPSLTAQAALGVGVWIAGQVASLVPAADRVEFARALKLARTVHARPAQGPVLLPELLRAAKTTAKDSRALGAARRTAGAAASIGKGKPLHAFDGASLAAERAVQALQEAGGGKPVRSFIATLDDQLLEAEVAGFTEDAVACVLWRAANDRGVAALWLARFADGTYGLRRKVGPRFVWVRGSRDDALAGVPDGMFEAAVASALARDR